MASSYLLVTALIATTLTSIMAAAVSSTGPDPKCHGNDCPKYTVLNKTETWELRRYGEIKWAATNGTAMSRDTITSKMFFTLFEYISGKNVKDVKIPMTTPVLTKATHGPGPTCESDFTMHFMIPLNQQDAPIAPTDPKVFIATTPSMDVFVRTFGGFAQDQEYIDNLKTLSQEVAHVSNVEDKYFFMAGYDGPYTFANRHNEVWLVKM